MGWRHRWTRVWRFCLAPWGSVLSYCALIFVLSAQSDLHVPQSIPATDKLAHLCLYAGLGWVWARAVKAQWPSWTPLRILLLTLFFAVGYGATDELHQAFVPGRFSDLHDVWADGLGGAVGGQCYLLWAWKKATRVA